MLSLYVEMAQMIRQMEWAETYRNPVSRESLCICPDCGGVGPKSWEKVQDSITNQSWAVWIYKDLHEGHKTKCRLNAILMELEGIGDIL